MPESNDVFYFDYAAATPMSEHVKHAMKPYFDGDFFNPSAPYIQARKVRDDYLTAKSQIASSIGAKGQNLVITCSATEANNLAFTAIALDAHVIVSPIEHPSVTRVAEQFEHLEYLKVDHHGRVDIDALESQITAETQFISVALANHELGTIQPLSDIAALIRTERLRRLRAGSRTPLYLHCDASAALNVLPLNVARLGADLVTISAAKIYGPKGVAALFISPDVRLKPQIVGGNQENGQRSGTENVPGVIGFAAAITDAQSHAQTEAKRLNTIKTDLVKLLEQRVPEVSPIIFRHQLASHLPLVLDGFDAERAIFFLEDRGILVSTGAACSASKGEKSNVLTAINLTDSEIAGSLRVTLGKHTSDIDIKALVSGLEDFIATERARHA